LTPYLSPNFGHRELKFLQPLEFKATHLNSKFHDPNPNPWVWGDDRRNKKIRIFRQKGHISNQFTGQSTKRR